MGKKIDKRTYPHINSKRRDKSERRDEGKGKKRQKIKGDVDCLKTLFEGDTIV